MTYQNLQIEHSGHIQRITIAREEKLNALNKATLAALHDAVTAALAADAVRGIMLTGAGVMAFVAGAVIAEISSFNTIHCQTLERDGQNSIYDLDNQAHSYRF